MYDPTLDDDLGSTDWEQNLLDALQNGDLADRDIAEFI